MAVYVGDKKVKLYVGNSNCDLAQYVKPLADFTIAYKLSNCKSNNSLTTIKENSSYSTKFTANNGYIIDTSSIQILMDGVNITSLVYNMATHELYIDKVTGNIDITINAT